MPLLYNPAGVHLVSSDLLFTCLALAGMPSIHVVKVLHFGTQTLMTDIPVASAYCCRLLRPDCGIALGKLV